MTDYDVCYLCNRLGIPMASDPADRVCIFCNSNPSEPKGKKRHKQHIPDVIHDESPLEEQEIQLFEKYKPLERFGNTKHPCELVESSVLHAIPLPECNYELSDHIQNTCTLSNIQKETIAYICQRIEQFSPYNSERLGYYLGDSTGCGKGRCIAGSIYEQHPKCDSKKHIWVSISPDLFHDSQRDFKAIDFQLPLFHILSPQTQHKSQGVMFMTYQNLVSEKRYVQLTDWCGYDFDGMIVFDESHRGKNSIGNENIASKTSKRMIQLQALYPNARVLYVSATGCSTIENMGYMTRLGLWNNHMFPTMNQFMKTIQKGGYLSHEMVAMELKSKGAFISRQLSYSKVTSSITYVEMTSEFKDIYNKAVQFMNEIRDSGVLSINKNKAKMIYGSAALRYFKSLLIAFKLPETIEVIQQAIEQNYSVVISIQSTYECFIQNSSYEEFEMCAPSIIIDNMLKQLLDMNTPPESEPDSIEMQKNRVLLHEFSTQNKNMTFAQKLDYNVIDVIVTHFGKNNVAEITGRKQNVCSGNIERRTETNLQEQKAFMNGSKKICIISSAGSVGISLQSDRKHKNKNRRVHILLELPWSAEQFIQQCGRTHRSGQIIAPHYQFIMTPVPGEKRFMNVIMQRLQSLGALTMGNRYSRCNLGDGCQTNDNFDNILLDKTFFGNFIRTLHSNHQSIFDKCTNIHTFFNRMMLLSLEDQDKVFHIFENIYNQKKQASFESTHIDSGIHDIPLHQPAVVHSDREYMYGETNENTLRIMNLNIKQSPLVFHNSQDCILLQKKSNKNDIVYATKHRKNGDMYIVYFPNKMKTKKMDETLLFGTYVPYCSTHESFTDQWNSIQQTSTLEKKISFISGNLFDIWLYFRTSKVHMKLKRIQTNKGLILGFHVSDKFIPTLIQLLRK